MRRMILASLIGVLTATGVVAQRPCADGNAYFYVCRDLNNPSTWLNGFTVNGLTQSGTGVNSSSVGSMMYTSPSFPTVKAVNMVLELYPPLGSATFEEILASADLSVSSYYYSVKLASSSITVYRNYGGVVALGSVAVSPVNGMSIRTVMHYDPYGNMILEVLVDGTSKLKVQTDGINVSGYVGFRTSNSGANKITHVDVEVPDSTVPNAIPSASIIATPFVNHVSIQWPTGTDNSGGSGVLQYQLLKNGQVLATSTTNGTYDDLTANPSTTTAYTVRVVDYFFNFQDTVKNVTTPSIPSNPPYPSAIPEGRQVGVRPTGTYWGAGGENIDIRSGNLNFTLPILTARSRTGWGVPFSLSYNSQNWRYESSANWHYGGDVGYGYAWLLQAGSVTPVWNPDGLTAAYYIFTDSTGGEYRLDQNAGNVWSSKESVYVWFDANTATLYFRDGSSWYMGCTSNSAADAGVLYPTLMRDITGNQITVTYVQGAGASWSNSSAKIDKITDVRASSGSYTYSFSYSSGFSISNTIGSGENYSFGFSTLALTSPFDAASFGSVNVLTAATLIPGNFTFQYNNFGEMTRATLPQGGYLGYDYGTIVYSSGRNYREVTQRYLSKDGLTQTAYPFTHEPSPGPDVHQYTVLNDPGGLGQKYWNFATSGTYMGLVSQYQGRQLPGPVTLTQSDFTWSQSSLNSYISSATTTADPGQSYQVQKKSNQSVDAYGNVTQVQQFNYGNLTTPARTNNYSYSNDSNLVARYIRNRLTTASVTDGTNSPTLVTNLYGTNQGQGSWGRPTSSQTLTGTRTFTYDAYGNIISTALNGVTTSITMDAATSSVPAQATVNSLTETMTYNSFLGLTNETGPNGVSSSISYQNIIRPSSTTSPLGAYTGYTYAGNATTGVINGRWTRATTDGLGRTIKTETGTGMTSSPPVSITETEYDSCGCSPAGKLKRTSLPHAPNAAIQWTTYFYDGIGRTTAVVSPDGESATRYSYRGNTVTVSDPAGKWKKYVSDAFGRLAEVNEPNPATTVSTVKAFAVKAGMSDSSVSAWPQSWSAARWNYRRTITIDHTKVSGSTALTNFAVLVSVTDANLKTVANGGSVGKVDGTDIYFTGSDGTTKLSHEIESYDATTGQLVAWVKVPSLSPTTDTVLYAYYGNTNALDQQNKTAVWDSNYKGVYHLSSASYPIADSTSNAFHGFASPSPGVASGKVGNGLSFSANAWVVLATTGTLSGTFTAEAWAKPFASTVDAVLGSRNPNDYSFDFKFLSGTQIHGNIGTGGAWLTTTADASLAYTTNTWYHLTYVVTPTSYTIYANGAQIGSGTLTNNGLLYDSNHQLRIGGSGCCGELFNGQIDEVRISSSARSADWILTGYRNQNSPDTFSTLGAQQSSGGGGGADTTPPVITNVTSGALTASVAAISWTTDESSDTQVEYGTTTGYGNTSTNSASWISHIRVISGLSASTFYHYRVKSRDAAGNLATSGDFTFTTPASSSASANIGILTTSGDGRNRAFVWTGVSNFNYVLMVIDTSGNLNTYANSCVIQYFPSTNLINVFDDNGNGQTGVTPGSTGTSGNSRCSLDVPNTSVVNNGTTLALTLAMNFQSTFTGTWYQWMSYVDGGGAHWSNFGTWTTPGSAGSAGGGGGGTPVEAPTFSQDGPSLTITSATSGATIYYTTDGSTPTTSSAVYSGPVTLSTSPYLTDYTYDLLDHLTNVSMPRPSGTQTRTFSYGTPPGPFLLNANNPENGTVSYTYDSSSRLATKIDAKGQKLVYSYDSYNRVTQVKRYYNTTTEDTQQRTTYYYDANPWDSYSNYALGRLAAVEYYGGNCTALGPPRTGCDKIQESYNYSVAGLMLGKRVKLTRSNKSGTLVASWTYDNEGRVTNSTYPAWVSAPGSSYNFSYNTLGQLTGMTNALSGASVMSNVTYGVAGEMLSMTGMLNETRTYNSMFQLTRITVPSVLDIQYVYSAANNNGKISSQTDVLSGEEITYAYDALNRLATAVTTDNPNVTQWGQSYTFDGFGNLTDQNVIKGSAPTMHVVYNSATNRQTGDVADANGNIGSGYSYDIENRLLKAGTGMPQYGYDAGNKRIERDTEFTFWAGNQKWATYTAAVSGSAVTFTLTGTNVYFGGRLIAKGTYNSGGTNDKITLASVAQDRLGSMNGKFYPFGQERPSATTNDKEKFTGYFRDAATGLDYADQRYEQPGVGRFMTPDSARGTNLRDPSSWNRYAYVGGDPINRVDPTGQYWADPWVIAGGWGGYGDAGGYFGFDLNLYIYSIVDAYLQELQQLTDQYNYSVSLLQPLQDEGLIDGYSVDFWTGGATLSFQAGARELGRATGICVLIPGCIESAGAIIIVSATIIYGPAIIEALRNVFQYRDKTPATGTPNSTQTFPTPNGKVVRVYGPDGRAVKDIDYGDQAHSGNDPEVHDWDWSQNPPRNPVGRAPNPGEIP